MIAPLLGLFLLAGCVAPVTFTPSEPGAAKAAPSTPGAVTISVRVPRSEYQTQNMVSDIKTLVFGLVDTAQNDAYFGYANDGTTNASLPESGTRYHLALAGNGNGGSGQFSGDGLTDGQWSQTKRYLYAITADASKQSMTFAGVRDSVTPRYVAFVAAFGKDAATLSWASLEPAPSRSSTAFRRCP